MKKQSPKMARVGSASVFFCGAPAKNPHPKWSKPMRAPSEITFTPFLPHQKEALIVQRIFKLYTFKLILNPTDWIIELDAPRIKYQTC